MVRPRLTNTLFIAPAHSNRCASTSATPGLGEIRIIAATGCTRKSVSINSVGRPVRAAIAARFAATATVTKG